MGPVNASPFKHPREDFKMEDFTMNNEDPPPQLFVVSVKGNAARGGKSKRAPRNCIRTRMLALDPPEPIKRPPKRG